MKAPTYHRIVALDTETTGRAPKPHFPATPSWPANECLMMGTLDFTDYHKSRGWEDSRRRVRATRAGDIRKLGRLSSLIPAPGSTLLLVGQNIAFDLHVLSKIIGSSPGDFFGDDHRLQVWDIGIAHYVLHGQNVEGMDLDSLCDHYCIPITKSATIKEHFKNGGCASALNQDELEEYMRGDIVATAAVAEEQFKLAEDSPHMYPLLSAMMDMALVKAEMEYNGIPYSIDAAKRGADECRTKIDAALVDVRDELGKLLPPTLSATRLGSARLSFLVGIADPLAYPKTEELIAPTALRRLFYEDSWECDEMYVHTFKNGKSVMRKRPVTVEHTRLVSKSHTDRASWPITPGGELSLDDRALSHILQSVPKTAAFIRALREVRRLEKLLGTYFENTPTWAVPHSGALSTIHTSYNLCVTKTGRLSSSSPNLQNPPPEAKVPFVAPSNHVFLEIDYKQLEVVGLAILSGCAMLQGDIRAGRDIHTELYKDMYGTYPSKEERKAFKPLTFGLIYGAGTATLAENAGVTAEVAAKFKDTFFRRYPGVERYYTQLKLKAKDNRVPTSKKDAKSALPIGVYSHTLPTGRRLVFHESPLPWSAKELNFSPADLQNWPVQSLATGDIIPTMLGVLARKLWAHPYHYEMARLCGTTHDSILLLVNTAKLDEVWSLCYNTLNRTSETIAAYYGMEINVPLEVTGQVGATWYQCGAKSDSEALAPPTTK